MKIDRVKLTQNGNTLITLVKIYQMALIREDYDDALKTLKILNRAVKALYTTLYADMLLQTKEAADARSH